MMTPRKRMTSPDGGFTTIIVDVLVLTEYKKTGIGKETLPRSLAIFRGRLEKDQKIMVNLMAEKE